MRAVTRIRVAICSMAAIKMPNRNMFVSDPRPDAKTSACMTRC